MSDSPRILITNHVPAEHLSPLQGVGTVLYGPPGGDLMPRAEVLRLAPTLDAIINQAELMVDAELLDAAPLLKIVANVAIGTDNLDKELMAKRGVWATNCPEAFTNSAADFTLALLLSVTRRLCEADRFVREERWRGFQPGVWDGLLLSGKTIGIIGYGKIGRAVAARARAFGMRVLFHEREPSREDGYQPLDALLAESDVITLHVPLLPQTHHLINAPRLRLVKRGAWLINVSRGKVVDEAALVEALASGQLAGAGLDVFEDEPAVHPALLKMPNVVLSPHIGGGTRESRRAARLLCAENAALVLRGLPPRTPVNQPRGRE